MDVVGELSEASRRLGLAGRRVLVAVSGGLDSTVLVHGLRTLPERLAPKLLIGHVNHGLRGDESDADEEAVRALGRAWGVPVEVARVDPHALREGRSSRTRPTLQEAARRARYAALRQLASAAGAEHLATAHQADDQAETVLLRLLRGSGPDGLGGIPERSPDGVVVRPLLRVPRSAIEAYARGVRLTWREDGSNGSRAYTRNRLRRDFLPALARAFNPRLLRAIGDLAEAQRRDSEWIEAQVEREAASRIALEGRWLRLDAKDWGSLPPALTRRLARLLLRRAGASRDVSRVHLERILGFLERARPGTHIQLPGPVELIRDAQGFRMGPVPPGGSGAVASRGAC